jgi:hypothetical protein
LWTASLNVTPHTGETLVTLDLAPYSS